MRSTVVARSNATRGIPVGDPGAPPVLDNLFGDLPSSCWTACKTSSTMGLATFSLRRSS